MLPLRPRHRPGQACSRSGGASARAGSAPASRAATRSVPRNHVHSSDVAAVYNSMIVTRSTA